MKSIDHVQVEPPLDLADHMADTTSMMEHLKERIADAILTAIAGGEKGE
jgi:hypothetical protein